jgi:hypothetical protein
MYKKIILLGASYAAICSPAYALDVEMRGSAGVEARIFLEDTAYANQERDSASVTIDPDFYYAIPDSSDSISFNLHARIDSADEQRSNADIRELSYLKVGDGWEIKAGISKVYWGVTEGQHLVDIVNQTDAVENIDGEDKLGQPMLNLTLLQWQDYGVFDVFVLPGFRERTFAGQDGRLRPQLVIDTDRASYEAKNNEKHVDGALRWAHSIDVFDIGVSHFWGTSRDPILQVLGNPIITNTPIGPQVTGFNQTELAPHYAIINQTGLDLQASLEGWLLKLEAISREGKIKYNGNPLAPSFARQRYTALATGFEFTVVDFAERGIDLGLIMEWNFDDRKKNATSTFQNDLLIGTRWAMNDAESTEVLVGLSQDLDYDTTSLSVEGSTRISDHLKLTLESRIFTAVDDRDSLVKQLEKDSFIQAQLDYFF